MRRNAVYRDTESITAKHEADSGILDIIKKQSMPRKWGQALKPYAPPPVTHFL